MSKENPIVITRGYHVSEFSAFSLARRSADELVKKGYSVSLLTFPIECTGWGMAFRNNPEKEILDHKELAQLCGLDPNKVFFHDFHNYQIPEDCSSFQVGHVDNMSNWKDQDLDGRLGIDLYHDETYNWNDDMSDIPINMAVYEIPALWKLIPTILLEKIGGKFITSSPSQYDNKMVDYNLTKKAGLMNEKMIGLLVQSILKIHRHFPAPMRSYHDLDRINAMRIKKTDIFPLE